MQLTLKTLHISRHGLPSLLLISEHNTELQKEILVYLIWPEEFGKHAPATRLIKMSMPYSYGTKRPDLDEVIETMREAALAGAIQRASAFCTAEDRAIAEELKPSTLRAWRSAGLYRGLQSDVIDERTATFIKDGLDHPYAFNPE